MLLTKLDWTNLNVLFKHAERDELPHLDAKVTSGERRERGKNFDASLALFGHFQPFRPISARFGPFRPVLVRFGTFWEVWGGLGTSGHV